MTEPPGKQPPRSFLRDAFSVLSGRAGMQLAGFLTGIVVARVLGVEGKGLLVALLLAPQLLITIAEFGMRNAVAFHIGRQTWSTERTAETALTLAIVSGCVGLVAALCWILLTRDARYSPTMIALAVLLVPAAVLYNSTAGIFLGLQRIPDFAFGHWGPGLFKLLATVIFVGIAGLGVEGAVGAVTVSAVLVALVMLWRVSRLFRLSLRIDKTVARQLLGIGGPYALVYCLMVLVYKANIVLVQQFGGIEALGYYALGANLAELLWQLPGVVSAIVFTRSAASRDAEAFSGKVASLARLSVLIGAVGALFAAWLAPWVVPLIYGAAFAPSVDIMIALLPGAVAMIVFKILRQDLSGRGKPWAAAWIIAAMLLSAVGLGAVVIPAHGALGAAAVISTIYVLGTIALVIRYASVCAIPIGTLLRYRQSDFAWLRRMLGR